MVCLALPGSAKYRINLKNPIYSLPWVLPSIDIEVCSLTFFKSEHVKVISVDHAAKQIVFNSKTIFTMAQAME